MYSRGCGGQMLQARKNALTGYHVNITLKNVSKYPFHQITLSCTILHSLLYRNSDTWHYHNAYSYAHECSWACKERQTSMLLVPRLKLDWGCKSEVYFQGFSRDRLQNKVSKWRPLHWCCYPSGVSVRAEPCGKNRPVGNPDCCRCPLHCPRR